MRLLLIEDDADLAKATIKALSLLGYLVDHAQNHMQMGSFYKTYQYDALLLDLGLPDKDGMFIIQSLRNEKSLLPIIVLTARDQINDRVEALLAGADDFVVKPYDIHEVHARILAVQRRMLGRSDNYIHLNDLKINTATHHVHYREQAISLTSREFLILKLLAEKPDQIFTRQQIEDTLYQFGDEVSSNAIEVHIHHLRKKIHKNIIKTQHGIGYCLPRNFSQ